MEAAWGGGAGVGSEEEDAEFSESNFPGYVIWWSFDGGVVNNDL